MNISQVPASLKASDFHFTDCKIAAAWGSKLQASDDIPYLQTIALLYHGLGGYLNRTHNTNITEDDPGLFIWLLNNLDDAGATVFDAIWDFTEDNCWQEYCQSLQYEGFSDLTGRGMVFNFFIEAGLVTAFLVVLLIAARREHLSKKPFQNKYLRDFVSAVQESTRTFLDAALIFCISLLFAAIKTFANLKRNSHLSFTNYSVISSAFLSLFSIIPPFLLHMTCSEELRRVKWRRAVWGFIISLAVVMVALYYNLPDSTDRFYTSDTDDARSLPDSNLSESTWSETCEDQDSKRTFAICLVTLLSTVFGVMVVYVIFVLNIFRVPWLDPARHPSSQTFRRRLLYIIGALSFGGMWTILGLFMYYRHMLGKLTGNSNKDHEWSFGQILALATWVPVVVEVVCVWVLGPEMGLSGQVSKRFKVVESDHGKVPGEKLERNADSGGVKKDSQETLPMVA